jgi:dephospho-CoA kinase
MANKKIFGLTGMNASGKTTFCDFLKNNDYNFISLSDFLRIELDLRMVEKTRENLINVGNELRNEYGAGVLGIKAREFVDSSNNNKFVIDSIRNPKEILELKKIDNFKLIGITTNSKTRYDRAVKRNRNENFSSYEEFVEKEKEELSSNENSQQLHKCLEMADIIIENNSSKEDFINKIKELIND